MNVNNYKISGYISLMAVAADVFVIWINNLNQFGIWGMV